MAPDRSWGADEPDSSEVRIRPRALGGWLIVLGPLLVLSLYQGITSLLSTFPPILTYEAERSLQNSGNAEMIPSLSRVLIFEFVGSSLITLGMLILIVLFLAHSRFFPAILIVVAIIRLAFPIVDEWLLARVDPEYNLFGPVFAANLVKGASGSIIWVPYVLWSQRVKETFLR